MKLSKSKVELKEKGGGRMDWVDDVSNSNLKLIAILELLAAIGLIVPHLTGILPWLIPLAATGLVILMISTILFHIRRGDSGKLLSLNIMLLLIALFVAYGRYILVPY